MNNFSISFIGSDTHSRKRDLHPHLHVIVPNGGNTPQRYRGVLPDKDIINYDENNVTFRYKDSTTNQITTRTLPTLKFLMLILQHVLPKGLQRVRDYGLLSSSAKKLRLIIQLLLLPVQDWLNQAEEVPLAKAKRLCPCCQHEMHCIGIARTPSPKGE